MIADRIKAQEVNRLIKAHLNTGTMFDIATGTYKEGIFDKYYLNGGVYTFNSVIGRPQTYKSTTAMSLLSRILHIYPETEAIIYDTENSITSKARVISLKGDLKRDSSGIESRLFLTDKGEYDMDTFATLLKEEANERMKRMKDLIRETPFINPNTQETYLMVTPLIVLIDSWTAMESLAEFDMFAENDISDSGMNRISMVDGNKKALFLRNLINLATRAGIYVIATAHTGSVIKITQFDSTSKDLQHMRNSDKIKGASEKFAFYSMNLFDSRSSELLTEKDSKNQSNEFPYKTDTPDLNLVTSTIVKCKNNMSGTLVSNAISQFEGLLGGMSSYLYLRDNKFGVDTGGVNKTVHILDDVKFTRKTIRGILHDQYEVGRALEILSNLHYIRKYWNIEQGSPLDKISQYTDEDLINMFTSNKGALLDDILNSRGYWLFDEKKKTDERQYLGIFDIINLLIKEKVVEEKPVSKQLQQVRKRADQKLLKA